MNRHMKRWLTDPTLICTSLLHGDGNLTWDTWGTYIHTCRVRRRGGRRNP